MNFRLVHVIILALAMAFAQSISGYFIGNGIQKFRMDGNSVKVKGLSEKEVVSNKASLNIVISSELREDDSVKEIRLRKDILEKIDQCAQLVQKEGFDLKSDDFEIFEKTKWKQFDGKDKDGKIYTYSKEIKVLSAESIVITEDVEKARKFYNEWKKLKNSAEWKNADLTIQYDYSELDKIRAGMLKESTINARKMADQFARDSKSEVGKIVSATQGQFEVSDIHSKEGKGYKKNVRVVTNVTFMLG